jgi:hypothetical protein
MPDQIKNPVGQDLTGIGQIQANGHVEFDGGGDAHGSWHFHGPVDGLPPAPPDSKGWIGYGSVSLPPAGITAADGNVQTTTVSANVQGVVAPNRRRLKVSAIMRWAYTGAANDIVEFLLHYSGPGGSANFEMTDVLTSNIDFITTYLWGLADVGSNGIWQFSVGMSVQSGAGTLKTSDFGPFTPSSILVEDIGFVPDA